ncbi:MAG TPA: histidine kinase [Ktedonobacteraceae bacterium]
MNQPFTSTPPIKTPGQPEAIATRLHGSWLILARSAWIIITTLAILHLAISISLAFVQLQTVCQSAGCLTPATMQDLHTLGLSPVFFALFILMLQLIFTLASVAIGLVIFWRKSDDDLALFVSLSLVTFGMAIFSGTLDYSASGFLVWRLLVLFLLFFGNISPIIFFYIFPDGRFVPRWTRIVAVVIIVVGLCRFFFTDTSFYQWFSPYAYALFILSLAIGVFAQIYRYFRVSGSIQRQQTKWVVFGITIAVVGSLLAQLVLPLLPLSPISLVLVTNTIYYLSLLFLPLTFGIAILRYRLWEINILINRTLVYILLTLSVVGIYILIVGSLGVVFQTRGNLLISLIATGLVAVLFQPLRARLQRNVNRLIYGDRDDPYAVLSRLGQRIEVTLAPEAVLPTIVETVAQALKLPYAAITVKSDEQFIIAASYGANGNDLMHVPLIYQAEQVGELLLAPRVPGEAFTAADKRLLNDLAHEVGVAVHAVRLTSDLNRLTIDLQRSRERLVLAREEERRRLRRDLHDDLAPTLAALALTASNVGDLIPTNPAAAIAMTGELQNEIRATVGNIRHLVYELRPPTLDELGLVAAIRERAVQYSNLNSLNQTDNGRNGTPSRLQVKVEAPDSLPPLPAAVEVAAYRIVQEAITNVTRHAQARTCVVRLSLTDVLQVEVLDDGIGLPVEHKLGVGLLSMRERAAELGGSCVIEKINETGTRVCARLPVTKE